MYKRIFTILASLIIFFYIPMGCPYNSITILLWVIDTVLLSIEFVLVKNFYLTSTPKVVLTFKDFKTYMELKPKKYKLNFSCVHYLYFYNGYYDKEIHTTIYFSSIYSQFLYIIYYIHSKLFTKNKNRNSDMKKYLDEVQKDIDSIRKSQSEKIDF